MSSLRPHLDLDQVTELAEMCRTRGPKTMQTELIQPFLDEGRRILMQLGDPVISESEQRHSIHLLSGMCANLGALRMLDLVTSWNGLTPADRAGRLKELHQELDTLVVEFSVF